MDAGIKKGASLSVSIRVHLCLKLLLGSLGAALPVAAGATDFTDLDPGRGLRLFNNYCIACHEHDGTGSRLAREDIRADMPELLARKGATPLAYFRQIYHGGGGMPQMHDELSERDIWNIIYAIPLIRQQEHSEWHPKRFGYWFNLRKEEAEDGKH